MGDFNVDLLKYETDRQSSDFFDLLSSFNFRPLILQPTRVTATSATLIDNIFVNSIGTDSLGGNLTISISDHFAQFSAIDIFKKSKQPRIPVKRRCFKNFSPAEFDAELKNIDWAATLANKNCEDAFSEFYKSIDSLLDEMAPFRTLTKKEQHLAQRPWINHDILEKIHERNKIHKTFLNTVEQPKRSEIFDLYKQKRNEVISLTRKSKKSYFENFLKKIRLTLRKYGKVSKILSI